MVPRAVDVQSGVVPSNGQEDLTMAHQVSIVTTTAAPPKKPGPVTAQTIARYRARQLARLERIRESGWL